MIRRWLRDAWELLLMGLDSLPRQDGRTPDDRHRMRRQGRQLEHLRRRGGV